jgi:hypothetical protein
MKCLRVILSVMAISVAMGMAAPGAIFVRVDPASEASVLQAGGISLGQAVAMVQARYGAKVMRAETVNEGDRVVHYIRLMSADRARVWTVRVDAATGQEF